jgi:hypothetical protein
MLKKKMNRIICFLLFISNISFAQTKPNFGKTKSYTYWPRIAGFKMGITGSDYYRDAKDKFQKPLKEPNLGLNIGLVADIINLRWFATQAELAFVMKGAKETFINGEETIKTKSNLNYLQFDLIPLQLKPLGFPRFNPYVSGGLYWAKLVSSKFEYTISRSLNGTEFIDEPAPLKVIDLNKNDKGYFLNAGLKMKRFGIEYRHEFGLSEIIKGTNIKNQLNNITLKFTY